MKKATTAILVFCLLCCMILPVRAEEMNGIPQQPKRTEAPSGEEIAADAVLVRPVGLVAIVLGVGLAIVATPFALTSGSTKQVWDRLVCDPAEFTIHRPLGEF
jgi:hypothetical protein